MKTRLVVIVLLLIVIVAGYSFFKFRSGSPSKTIQVSGNIEATTVDVGFKIPGRLIRRFVDEGAPVKKGEVIARLDDAQLLQAVAQQKANVNATSWALTELLNGSRPEEIAQARAAEQKARFALSELLRGSRPQEIAQAAAQVKQAGAEARRSRNDAGRADQLYRQGFISAQAHDLAATVYKTDKELLHQAEEHYKLVLEGPRIEDIQQAREMLAQARANLQLVLKGPRKEEIIQARARLEAAKEALAQTQTILGDSVLVSPVSGIVVSKNAEEGEYVSAGTPVVTVADLAKVWLRAYIDETDLGRIKLGQEARVTTDTYPRKIYPGHVSFISSEAEFTPKNVQTTKERVKLVYRIKIDIENPNQELKPGMPADAVL